jgi:CheY-like chemotaxis protein
MTEVRILVVDDTPIACQATSIVLRTLGFNTDEVGSGYEALSNIQTRAYDLIFMDYNMPHMNGLECTQKIREWEVLTGTRIPIIGLSASVELNVREKCLQAGMDDYLSKSYTREDLQQIVQKWLGSHH